ncbi:hypothetical protein [Paenibacillus larvae]|uniref:Uncharacterized protein n=1 Tax=Paenibacillus larvae subsp. larvae TaxID=147375 RepID=A0A6C0QV88_9BACL|nr:hypothetical protein [Paenibacillus larvae]QHZ52136.1 hypothetical protein ERICV_03022 [Paenibacillus larvae subsp. larvae]
MAAKGQIKVPRLSMDAKKILTKWAHRVLRETPDFDISECATIQCGLDWGIFQKEMYGSSGWDDFMEKMHTFMKRTDEFYQSEDLEFYEVDLLNIEIERIYK